MPSSLAFTQEFITEMIPVCNDGLDLAPSHLHELPFQEFLQIANLCKNLNTKKIPMMLMHFDEENFASSFKKLSYAQQQQMILLFLELLYSEESKEYDILSMVDLYEEKYSLTQIPFNLQTHPDAFYKILHNLMEITPHVSLKGIIYLIFHGYQHKVLTTAQTCELLSIFTEKFLDIEFNPKDMSVKNICVFLNMCSKLKHANRIFYKIWNNYTFKNNDEQATFLRYAAKTFRDFYSFMDVENLEYETVIALAHKLKDTVITERYLIKNNNILPTAYKLELIDLIINYDAFGLRILHELKLSEEQILAIYKKTPCTYGLINALKALNWDKHKIFKYLEEYIQELNPSQNSLSPIDELELTYEEVTAFAHRNPQWSHIFDAWVKDNNTSQAKEVLATLLKYRLANSPYNISAYKLELYGCILDEDIQQMSAYFNENIEIDASLDFKLSWDFIYDRKIKKELQADIINAPLVLRYAGHASFNPLIKTFYTNIPIICDNENANQTLATDEKASVIFELSYKVACENLASILDEPIYQPLINITKKLYSSKSTQDKLFIYSNNFNWFMGFWFRLLQECQINSLKQAFNSNNSAVLFKSIEQIASIASPMLRTTLIECVVNLINNHEHFIKFNEMFDTLPNYKQIPTLIIFAHAQNPMLFEEIILNIGSDFKNSTTKLQTLIQGLISIFNNQAADESRLKVLEKIFVFKLHIDEIAPSAPELKFNELYINISKEDNKTVSLLGYDINGQLLNINDLKQHPELGSLANLLNRKSDIKEKIAEIRKTGKFANATACQLQAFLLVQGINALNKIAIFAQDSEFDKKSWVQSYGAVLQECFKLTDDKLPLVIDTLKNCRKPYSLIAYFAKIASLNGNIYADMLQDYVHSLASEHAINFYNNRYNLEEQSQLALITATTNNPDFLKVWQQSIEFDYAEFYAQVNNNFSSQASQQLDIAKFIIEKIQDFKHLSEIDYYLIHDYLETDNEYEQKNILEKTRKTLDLQKNEREHGKLELQLKIMEYLEALKYADLTNQPLDDKKNLTYVNKIRFIAEINDASSFGNDLELITNILHKKREQHQDNATPTHHTELEIINTDHFWHMLLSGTDMLGSCQNINGTPNLNRHLLPTILSGHIRQLAIINASTQEIITRALLKLMVDTKANEPVLFLERIYPELSNHEHEQMLIQLAIFTAQKLGCSLVSRLTTTDATLYPNEVSIVAVKASEYCDALRGPQFNGYTLGNLTCLYRHFKPQAVLTFSTQSKLQQIPEEEENNLNMPRDTIRPPI